MINGHVAPARIVGRHEPAVRHRAHGVAADRRHARRQQREDRDAVGRRSSGTRAARPARGWSRSRTAPRRTRTRSGTASGSDRTTPPSRRRRCRRAGRRRVRMNLSPTAMICCAAACGTRGRPNASDSRRTSAENIGRMSGANHGTSAAMIASVTSRSARYSPVTPMPSCITRTRRITIVKHRARERQQAERLGPLLHAQHVERDEGEPDREGVQQHQPQRGHVGGGCRAARPRATATRRAGSARPRRRARAGRRRSCSRDGCRPSSSPAS